MRSVSLFVLSALVLAGQVVWAREPAPVIDAASNSAASQQLETRLSRVERLLENQTLVDLATRLDSLQSEVQQMLGQIEEQNHTLESLQKRQRDIYLDIDQRLRKLEEARAAAASMPAPSANVLPPMPDAAMSSASVPASAIPADTQAPGGQVMQVDPQAERVAYEQAFNLLKEGRYDLAVAAFKTFVQSYPTGNYADNAQYWLGEANYVQRHFEDALSEFKKVVNNFPNSPKRSDALLKMGYTYQELGDHEQARLTLNSVVTQYPNSTAANLAQKRLQDLKLVQ